MHILFALNLLAVTLTFRIVAIYVIVDVPYMTYTHLNAVSVFHTSSYCSQTELHGFSVVILHCTNKVLSKVT
jgi:hypothetical protein